MTKYLVFSITFFIWNLTPIQADIVDKLYNDYKNTPIDYFDYFHIHDDKHYFEKVDLKIDPTKPIVIIYDNLYTKDRHGQYMLNIIALKDRSNIFTYDYKDNTLSNANLQVKMKNLIFEDFLFNLSHKYKTQKIIVNISNGTAFKNKSNYEKNIQNIHIDNFNFIALINDLHNVYINKSFANIATFGIKESLMKILKNPKEEMLFLNQLDSELDTIYMYKEDEADKKIERTISKLFKHYDTNHQKNYAEFIHNYKIYNKHIQYEAIDCFSYLAAMKRYDKYKLKSRVSLIHSIMPSTFIYNYESLNQKMPQEVQKLYKRLKNTSKIDIYTQDGLQTVYLFESLMKKYKTKLPELYVGNYDYGLSREKTSAFYTGLTRFYIYGDLQVGNSYTTALKTFIDINKVN